MWLTPRLSDPRRALRFLDDFEVDLLDSGHVDVAAYVRAPQSTWRLTQHKTLVWMTVDDALHARVRGWLDEAGLPRREALPTIAAWAASPLPTGGGEPAPPASRRSCTGPACARSRRRRPDGAARTRPVRGPGVRTASRR
ncbi:MAG: hypothetical protein HS111_09415 [Kofleriaceae bacterium]|nr:hypothetical protein [Kofleriaceae bacterium]